MKRAKSGPNSGTVKKIKYSIVPLKVIKKRAKRMINVMANLMTKIISKNFYYIYLYIFSHLYGIKDASHPSTSWNQ